MSGDIAYENDIQRTISVDDLIIDKFAAFMMVTEARPRLTAEE